MPQKKEKIKDCPHKFEDLAFIGYTDLEVICNKCGKVLLEDKESQKNWNFPKLKKLAGEIKRMTAEEKVFQKCPECKEIIKEEVEKERKKLLERIENLNEEMFNSVEFYDIEKYQGVLELLVKLKEEILKEK